MNNPLKHWALLVLFLALVATAAFISAKYYSSAAGVNARPAGQTQVSPEPYKPTQNALKKATSAKVKKNIGNKLNKTGVSPEPYKPQTQNIRGVSPEPYKPAGVSPEPYKPAGVSPEPY